MATYIPRRAVWTVCVCFAQCLQLQLEGGAAKWATRLSGKAERQQAVLLSCHKVRSGNFAPLQGYLYDNIHSSFLITTTMPRQLHREDYTVGWICALPVEMAAALEMLDEEHADFERGDDNDENLYALGSIGGHNVAIVCLPVGRIGNNPAATVAMQMQATFKEIRFGLLVGIGGGVPSVEVDVRLGDVVVSQPNKTFGGVVQYDYGKATQSGFERIGSLNSPPQILLNAVAKVQANELRGESKVLEHIDKLDRIPIFQRHRAGPDMLFKAAYDHEGGQTCDACSIGGQEVRNPRNSEEEIVIHYGTIASGNQVMRSAVVRDQVSAELGGVLCFEIEAAGLTNSFPCLVVRGICDYADSHKNNRWQPYAAGTAAAYAKELLSSIMPVDVVRTRTVDEAPRSIDQKLSAIDKKTETLLWEMDIAKLSTSEGTSFDSHVKEQNSTSATTLTTRHIMDGLSEAASVISVVEISGKVASLCYQYSVKVRHAKGDIERLHQKVNEIKNILEKLQQLLSQDKSQLSTGHTLLDPLQKCSQELKDLEEKLKVNLEPGQGRKAMQQFRTPALEWPLTSKEVEKRFQNLENYGHIFGLALQVEQM